MLYFLLKYKCQPIEPYFSIVVSLVVIIERYSVEIENYAK